MRRAATADKFTLSASSLVPASILWVLVFIVKPLDFWIMLSLSTIILLTIVFLINRPSKPSFPAWPKLAVIGTAAGLLLYGLFYLGFQLTRSNPIIGPGVGQVYTLRSTMPTLLIGVLLIFPIGPSEEIYWRGLIQRRFAQRLGAWPGFLIGTAAYCLVHLPTLNPALLLTALIGGLVWGYLYKTTRSLLPGIISHIIFDLSIFVVLPFA